jgi:hypothetical protein
MLNRGNLKVFVAYTVCFLVPVSGLSDRWIAMNMPERALLSWENIFFPFVRIEGVTERDAEDLPRATLFPEKWNSLTHYTPFTFHPWKPTIQIFSKEAFFVIQYCQILQYLRESIIRVEHSTTHDITRKMSEKLNASKAMAPTWAYHGSVILKYNNCLLT